MQCALALQRVQPRSSAGSQAKRGAAGAGRGKAGTGHKGSKSGKAGKKGMKRSASFAFGPADGEPGMRRRSVNVSTLSSRVRSARLGMKHMTEGLLQLLALDSAGPSPPRCMPALSA